MINSKLGVFVIISFIIFPSLAKDFVFAIVGKEESSPYYLQAKKGCLAAAQKLPNVKCLYRGPSRTDVRLQNFILEELIEQGVDGIAVAIIQSVVA